MKKFLSLVLVFTLLSFSTHSNAAYNEKLNKEEIESIVEQFILENPEVILQSIENMQKKQKDMQEQSAKKVLEEKYDEIINNPLDPIAGNPKGDVTVVEFFDYNCGYCKYVLKHVTEVIGEDKKVKFVFKELPILGESSVKIAQIALAVNIVAPEKYFAFHTAVMNMTGKKDEAGLMKIVESLGVSASKVKNASADKKVNQILAENRMLAQTLGINGTPGFIIGKEIIPGAATAKIMKAKIKSVRESK